MSILLVGFCSLVSVHIHCYMFIQDCYCIMDAFIVQNYFLLSHMFKHKRDGLSKHEHNKDIKLLHILEIIHRIPMHRMIDCTFVSV